MSKPHKILSLDLGSVIGFAVIEDSLIKDSGEADFKLKKGEIEGDNFVRYLNFLTEYHDIDEVFFEKVDFIVNREHAESFMGFETITKVFCRTRLIPYTWLTVNDWKRELTGHCRIGQKKDAAPLPKDYEKIRMCAKLHSLGWKSGKIGTKENNNECDACGVAFAIFKLRRKELSFMKLDY